MKVIALLNAAAGPDTDDEQKVQAVREAFRASAVEADVRCVPAGGLTDAVHQAAAAGADAVVVGGGDGTISSAAGALAGSRTPLGVLPLGTLNHFAKDLGLPSTLEDAARVIAAGVVHTVDVGEVNGRVFINNSSIGLYPSIVRKREQQQQRLGRGKWMAMLMAIVSVLRRFPLLRVRVGVGGQSDLCTTPFVFIGNNRYEMDLLMLGARTSLDRGELWVYFPRQMGRLGLLWLGVRGLLGRLEQASDFRVLTVTDLWIDTPKHRLRVAVDGEVIHLAPPLHYRIRPRSLRVLVPPGAASVPQPEMHH